MNHGLVEKYYGEIVYWKVVGRKKPYSEKGIKQVPCVRCGNTAYSTWQVCADNRLHRPLCKACDIALNGMVLKWMGMVDWKEKMAKYKRQI